MLTTFQAAWPTGQTQGHHQGWHTARVQDVHSARGTQSDPNFLEPRARVTAHKSMGRHQLPPQQPQWSGKIMHGDYWIMCTCAHACENVCVCMSLNQKGS